MLPRKEIFLFAFCLFALAQSALCISTPCTGANAYCNFPHCACNAGYSGDGVTCNRVCLGDSTTKPGNGTAGTCTSQKVAGQTCAMTCNSGYYLSSGNLTRVCGTNGNWSAPTAVCSPKDCGPLTIPSHGYADPCPSTTYKSYCSFSCESPNYIVSGQRNYTCNANGVWERATFFPLQNGQCISISCGDLPLPANAVADPPCSLTTKGNWCAFNCLPPYVLTGQRNYTCSNFLSWERTTLFPLQDGECETSAWNGVIKGSIVGNYTNGCTVQSLTTLANYTFLLTCRTAPKISYLTFYQESSFTVAVQGYDIHYGGVNYISSSSSTVQSIWLQSRSTVYTKGTSTVMTPTARTILYSKYLQECWFDDIDKPVQDFQRCEAPLWCYFRGLSPQAAGQRGQCWYPTCKPQYCNATVNVMRDGYCHNNGTGYECRSFLAPGATGCGGYAGGAAVLPACDPFTSYCLNIAGVNTCVLSSCLVGGCNYGRACNMDLGLGAETCTGQGIPKIPDPWVKEFLAQVLPALPLSKVITTQAVKTKRAVLEEFTRETNATAIHKNRESLMMMPRMREGNSRSVDLFLLTPCITPGNCPVNQICVSSYCSSPSGTPCGPSPC